MVAILFLVLTAVQITPAKTLNNPPEKPTINGPTSGEAGKSYTYTAVSTDPDGDKIFYCFNWGDGNEVCTELYPSGQQVSVSHTWENKGDYTITVKATDEHGAESEPATLKVSMPILKIFKGNIWILFEEILRWFEQTIGRIVLPVP